MRVSPVSFVNYNSNNCTPIRKATPSFGDVCALGLDFRADLAADTYDKYADIQAETLRNKPWLFLEEVGYTKQDRRATRYFIDAFALKSDQMKRPDLSGQLTGLSCKYQELESWKNTASCMPNPEEREAAYEMLNKRSDVVAQEYKKLKGITRDSDKLSAYDHICRKTLKGEHFNPNEKVMGRSLVEHVILGNDEELALKIMKHKKFVAPEIVSDFAKNIFTELLPKAQPSKLVKLFKSIF